MCVWFSPQSLWESLAVFWTLSYTPLCQCVTFSKMDDHNTVFIPPLNIHHPFSLPRHTERKRYPSLHCFLLFPSGNKKERPFSDFTTSSKSSSSNWTSQDSTQLESFENKTQNSEIRNSHEQWGANSVMLTFLNIWVYHYHADSSWAGSFLFIFWAFGSRHTRISEICLSTLVLSIIVYVVIPTIFFKPNRFWIQMFVLD